MHVYSSGCLVLQELDELVHVRAPNEERAEWEPTDKGRLFAADLYEATSRAKAL